MSRLSDVGVSVWNTSILISDYLRVILYRLTGIVSIVRCWYLDSVYFWAFSGIISSSSLDISTLYGSTISLSVPCFLSCSSFFLHDIFRKLLFPSWSWSLSWVFSCQYHVGNLWGPVFSFLKCARTVFLADCSSLHVVLVTCVRSNKCGCQFSPCHHLEASRELKLFSSSAWGLVIKTSCSRVETVLPCTWLWKQTSLWSTSAKLRTMDSIQSNSHVYYSTLLLET